MSAVPQKTNRPRSLVLLNAAMAALALFALALLVGRIMNADHGTYPDWVAAIATLAAFGAAIVAAWYAHRALIVEQRRDRYRNRVERRSQAVKVGAWANIRTTSVEVAAYTADTPTQYTSGPTIPAEFTAMVRNTSDLPVQEFCLQVYLPSTETPGTWELIGDYDVGRVLPYDGKNERTFNLLGSVPTPSGGFTIPDPNHRLTRRLAEEYERRGVPSGQHGRTALGWSFVDISGVRWLRTPGAVLRPGRRPEVPSH